MQNDIFSEVFDGAIEDYIDETEPTDEEKEFQNEEEINPSLRTDIENLLTSGSIYEEVEIAGHVFVIRTLKIGEELSVAEICKEYEDGVAEAKALATATVAAAIETIDGRPLMRNLGPESKNNIRQKFAYIKNKWYWVIIGELYERYLILVNRQINAFSELRGKIAERSDYWLALLRLLNRQGLFMGDLNYVQRFALQEVIKTELREEKAKEELRFRMQAAIAFPESAREILAQSSQEDDIFDVPELEEYDPENPGFSDQSIETMLEALEEFGFYVEGGDK